MAIPGVEMACNTPRLCGGTPSQLGRQRGPAATARAGLQTGFGPEALPGWRAPHHRSVPTSASTGQELRRGPNDAYRSPDAVKTDGNLRHVGSIASMCLGGDGERIRIAA
jgi:hypothetical protein